MILTGNESLAGANSKGYRPKPPVSKADKVEAALRNELGHPPIPPTDAISITPEASMSSTSQKVFKDSSGINDGAILIFVDGFQAIRDLMDAFTADPILGKHYVMTDVCPNNTHQNSFLTEILNEYFLCVLCRG